MTDNNDRVACFFCNSVDDVQEFALIGGDNAWACGRCYFDASALLREFMRVRWYTNGEMPSVRWTEWIFTLGRGP